MRFAVVGLLLGSLLVSSCSEESPPLGSTGGASPGGSATGGSAAGGSAAGGSGPGPTQPDDWDADLRIPRAIDLSDDPNVFEMHLTAEVKALEILPGVMTEVYTFDGSLPGPEIRVKRGDRVIVHFHNELPEDTTIHWHGLRIPNDMDGVPGVSQEPIGPGEGFTYDFVVPDAGTFWYHPHVRSAAQVGYGMYGPFVVLDPDEPEDLGDDLTLILSDIHIGEDGKLVDADSGTIVDTIFGREGNVLLVNGKVEPVLRARAGRRQRWRILNAAKTRYFELGIEGQSFLKFAGDAGMSEHTVQEKTLIVVPAERKEVIFDPVGEPGTRLQARWIPTERGFGSVFGRDEIPLFSVDLTADPPYEDAPLPDLGSPIPPLDVTQAIEVPLEMTLDVDENGTQFLGINHKPHWDAEPLSAQVGETQLWVLKNSTDFSHPFHLHGFFFQVLSIDGAPPQVREWKDTVDIRSKGETRIAAYFDGRPGWWMTHCHILDHAELGMMTMVHVTDPNDPEPMAAAGAPGHEH